MTARPGWVASELATLEREHKRGREGCWFAETIARAVSDEVNCDVAAVWRSVAAIQHGETVASAAAHLIEDGRQHGDG